MITEVTLIAEVAGVRSNIGNRLQSGHISNTGKRVNDGKIAYRGNVGHGGYESLWQGVLLVTVVIQCYSYMYMVYR